MRLSSALAAFLPAALAMFADEAYKIDYQHALIGLPQRHATFFHQPKYDSPASLIYTLSDHGIIGAVNPKDGSLVWRQRLKEQDGNLTNGFLVPNAFFGTVVSAVERKIEAWSAVDGKLAWSRDKYLPGNVVDLKTLESLGEGETGASKDVLAVFDGETPVVQRIDGKTGASKWQYSDNLAETPIGVSMSPTHVFYISISNAIIGSPKVKVTVIDPSNGQKLDQITLNTDGAIAGREDIVHLDSCGQAPILVWADKAKKSLRVNLLGTKSTTSFAIPNKSNEKITNIIIHATNKIASPTHFLAMYEAEESHWGEVFHINAPKKTIKRAYDVARLIGGGSISTSVSNDQIYYTRIAKGAFIVLNSKGNDVVDRYLLADFGVKGVVDYPSPIMAVGEVTPAGERFSARAAVLLTSGDWVLILNGLTSWVRHEELSYITSAVFAELPRKQALANQLAAESHSTIVAAYVHRVKRHLADLKGLPKYLQALPTMVANSFLGKDPEGKAESRGDTFGFHKHVVISTSHGRLIALNTADQGKQVWSTAIPGFSPDGVPELVASSRGIVRVKTISEHSVIDSLTGKFLRKGKDTPKIKDTDTKTISYVALPDRVVGSIGIEPKIMWTYHAPPGFIIKEITSRPPVDPVALIGDVLGDRRVLYKYLNPNIALVTSISKITNAIAFSLIDTVSGTVLHTSTHPNVDTTQPIPAVLSENWFATSYTLSSTPKTPARGTVLTLTKLFESSIPDDRGPLGPSTNFSALASPASLIPHPIAQSFILSDPISHLSVSRSRQGIANRLLLAILPQTGSLAGIPLPAIDPRRPVNRDPSKIEQEEGLVRYAPNLDIIPPWLLSHARHVDGLTTILAAPALLESTSLVIAYGFGGDVFGVRTAPSGGFDVLGKEFNRVQMVGTVVALFVGVIVIAPVVMRKGNNMLWELGA